MSQGSYTWNHTGPVPQGKPVAEPLATGAIGKHSSQESASALDPAGPGWGTGKPWELWERKKTGLYNTT